MPSDNWLDTLNLVFYNMLIKSNHFAQSIAGYQQSFCPVQSGHTNTTTVLVAKDWLMF